jgi:hypothetical protein
MGQRREDGLPHTPAAPLPVGTALPWWLLTGDVILAGVLPLVAGVLPLFERPLHAGDVRTRPPVSTI